MSVLSVKKRVYEILEAAEEGDRASLAFDVFIMLLIILNVLTLILGSVGYFVESYYGLFLIITVVSLVVFSIEYFLRLWSCTASPEYKNPVSGRIKWALTPFAVIDFLVILPFYLLIFFQIDVTGIVILRVFRLFKIFRYSESVNTIVRVIKNEKDTLITTYVVLLILLIFAATLMYQFENPVQPEEFSSIPDAMWWGVITLTTVGYGDVVPVTVAGRLFGAIIALIGIGIFALPAGILASGFAKNLEEEMSDEFNEEVFMCPHCGEEIKGSELWIKGRK